MTENKPEGNDMSHEGNFSEVVIDIETYQDITDQQIEAMSKEIQAPKNWKDPAKIEKYIEDKKTELIGKAALSPRTGKVVCVGLGIRIRNESEWRFETYEGIDEGLILKQADTRLQELNAVKIITFNGKHFDIPFLLARQMKANQPTEFKLPTGYDKRHVDLFELLGRDGSLGAWSAAILGKPHNQDGSDVAAMVEAGQWDELTAYCLDDVRHTAELYERLELVAGP